MMDTSSLNWQMTYYFVMALLAMAAVTKVSSLIANRNRTEGVIFFCLSPLLSVRLMKQVRVATLKDATRLFAHVLVAGLALVLAYWFYWGIVTEFHLRTVYLSYLAMPIVLLIGEFMGTVLQLVYLSTGRYVPSHHDSPILSRNISDFWGRRWNRWLGEWFWQLLFYPLRHYPILGVFVTFAVSGIIHELVVSLPFYLLSGKTQFGMMLAYFLIQGGGLIMDRKYLRGHRRLRRVFVWCVVVIPGVLFMNEGVLRLLHLWPE